MVIVIGGPNIFACDQRIKDAIKDSAHITVELGDHDALSKLQQAVQGGSLFSSEDYVIARGVDTLNKTDVEELVKLAANTPKDTVLIIYAAGSGKSVTNKYKDVADIVHFEDNLKTYELIDWVVSYTKEQDGEIDKASARKLVDWVGDNQQTLSGEIEKLINYSNIITGESIEAVASKTPQTTIFQMLDSMLAGNDKQAIDSYKDLLAQKLDPHYIMSMICWQANALSIAHAAKGKDLDGVGKDTGVSAFVLKKSWSIARKLKKSQVLSINEQILDLDTQIKNAPVDVERSIEQLIRRLSTSL